MICGKEYLGNRMGLIKINQIEPWMVLAEDLKDAKGRFLLPGGASLTTKHVKTLKMWGVIEANIEGIVAEDVEDNAISKIDPVMIEMAEKIVRERFRYSNVDHPAIQELFRLCTLQKAEEMQSKQPGENAEFDDRSEGNVETNEMPELVTTKIDFNKFIQRHILKLPTLPMIFSKINETIVKPRSSANDIANVISKDTSLSARLLRIVNSAFYGFPSKIDSISRAVAIIGTRQLSTLASGVTIIDMFKDIPSDIIDMKSFWKHSIACGVNARIIASYQGIQNTERLFLAGLLHDIGRLILYNYAPDHSVYALTKAKCANIMLNKVEYEDLDFDHAKIGGLLLKKWKLPVLMEHAVMYHHNPQKSQDPLEPSIVHLADIMTNARGIGSSGERFVSPLDSDAWECIGLSANILDLTIKQADRHIEEIFKFFYSDEN
jgi:HD-like signal output (HDOD) protein